MSPYIRIILPLLLFSAILPGRADNLPFPGEADIETAMQLEKKGRLNEAAEVYLMIMNDTTETDYFRFYSSLGLGRILKEKGNIQAAFDAYEEGMKIARRIGDDFLDGNNARFNLASLYVNYGKYDDAEALLNKSSWRRSPEGARKACALRATILAGKGEGEKAIAIIDSILPEFSDDKYNRGVLIQNRGFILNDLKRYEEAEIDFKRASELLDGTEKYIALSNLALAQTSLGNYTEALRNIDAAISYFRTASGGESNDLAIALRKKGEILAAAKKMKEATRYFREFYRMNKKNIIRNLPDMSVSTRLDYWTKEKPSLSKIFLLENTDPDFLMDVALFRHHTSLLGMNDVPRLIKHLEIDNKGLRKHLNSGSVAVQFIEYEDKDGDEKYAALLTPETGKSSFIPLFGKNEIYNEELLVPYSLYSAVTSENTDALNRLYENQDLASMVWTPILSMIPGNTSDIYFAPEGIFHLWAIENMNYPPLEKFTLHRLSSLASITELHPDTDPDGAVLVIGGLDYSDPDPLLTESELTGMPHIRPNDEFHDRSAYTALMSFIHNSDIQPIFSALPATRYEAEGVAGTLRNPDKRDVISEETLKKNFGVYDQVHIATHGYCLDAGLGKRPKFLRDSIAADISLYYTGIALSGANHGYNLPGDDGLLSAREICSLDLSGVDLVVLSACQTAKGNITDEGVSGLVRALKMAGAQSVMASLWEVDDNSTRLFMEEFYRGLKSGKSKRESFNGARKWLKNYQITVEHRKFSPAKMAHTKEIETTTHSPYATPYYTSPFILID